MGLWCLREVGPLRGCSAGGAFRVLTGRPRWDPMWVLVLGCHGLDASHRLCPAHAREGWQAGAPGKWVKCCHEHQRARRPPEGLHYLFSLLRMCRQAHPLSPNSTVSDLNRIWRTLLLPALLQRLRTLVLGGPSSAWKGLRATNGTGQKTGQVPVGTRNTRSWGGSRASRPPGAGWQPVLLHSPHPRQDVPMTEGPPQGRPGTSRPASMARDGQTWTLSAEEELAPAGVWLSSALAGSLGTPVHTAEHTGPREEAAFRTPLSLGPL